MKTHESFSSEESLEEKDIQRERIIAKTSYSLDMGTAKELLFKMAKTQDHDMYDIAKEIIPEKESNPRIDGYDEFGAKIFKTNIRNMENFFHYYLQNRNKLGIPPEMASQMRSELDDISSIKRNGLLEMDKLSQIETASDKRSTTVFTQGDYFTHVKGISEVVPGAGIGEVECRLYLCPRSDKVIELSKAIINENLDDNPIRPYYFKFAHSGERNDRIVYYTNFERIPKDLEIFNKISKEQPELFRGMGKNPFWGDIEGAPKGVYFGEEPNQEKIPYEYEGGRSYGSIRAAAFEQAYQKWCSLSTTSKRFSTIESSSNISDTDTEDFYELFGEELEYFGVNPNNPCSNK